MEINSNQQVLIDQFLQGKLEGATLDNFLSEVEQNAILKKELNLQQAISDGIEFHGNEQLRQRFSKISKEVKKQPKPTNNSKRRFLPFVLLAASAIILLLVVSNLFFQNSKPKDLYAQFYEPFELSNTRSGQLIQETTVAQQLYIDEKYLEAVPALNTILELQPQNSKIQLALGNAYSHTNQEDQAIAVFQQIIDRNDDLYSNQASWYLALVHLKKGDTKKAKSIIQPLVDDPNADFHIEAKELSSLLSD